jgi:hypothetical protein
LFLLGNEWRRDNLRQAAPARLAMVATVTPAMRLMAIEPVNNGVDWPLQPNQTPP